MWGPHCSARCIEMRVLYHRSVCKFRSPWYLLFTLVVCKPVSRCNDILLLNSYLPDPLVACQVSSFYPPASSLGIFARHVFFCRP